VVVKLTVILNDNRLNPINTQMKEVLHNLTWTLLGKIATSGIGECSNVDVDAVDAAGGEAGSVKVFHDKVPPGVTLDNA